MLLTDEAPMGVRCCAASAAMNEYNELLSWQLLRKEFFYAK